MSGKGGVGKTLIASTMTASMAEAGFKVGLLDLDLTNPACHLVLGVDVSKERPIEDGGVLPIRIGGLAFMSVAFYTGGEALPLRGCEVDDVFREVLAVTRWGKLDLLVMDTPPGFGDVILSVACYVDKARLLAVTTPDVLSMESLRRLSRTHLRARILGVVVNMASKRYSQMVEKLAGLRVLGEIPYYLGLNESLGNLDKLLKTEFASRIRQVGLLVLSS